MKKLLLTVFIIISIFFCLTYSNGEKQKEKDSFDPDYENPISLTQKSDEFKEYEYKHKEEREYFMHNVEFMKCKHISQVWMKSEKTIGKSFIYIDTFVFDTENEAERAIKIYKSNISAILDNNSFDGSKLGGNCFRGKDTVGATLMFIQHEVLVVISQFNKKGPDVELIEKNAKFIS